MEIVEVVGGSSRLFLNRGYCSSFEGGGNNSSGEGGVNDV